MEVAFTWREYVPLFYVPIPKRHNPIVIVPTYNKVAIKVSTSSSDSIIISDELSTEVTNLIKIFLSLLQSEIGELPGLVIKVAVENSGKIGINSTYLYVAVTNAIMYFLSGEVSSEITESAKVFDRTIGVDDSVLALREFTSVKDGHAYIWRLNEGYVMSDKQVLLKLQKVNRYLMNYVEHEFTDLITHIAGVATIRVFEKLFNNKSITSELRTLNAVWHILYGVPLPQEITNSGYIYVKEIDGCSLYKILGLRSE